MTDYPNLNAKGIFVVEAFGRQLLYAPLRGITIEAEAGEIAECERILASGSEPPGLERAIGDGFRSVPPTPETTDELTILINQRCNFACKYCYSANGRSDAELSQELFPVITDWFVRKERLSESHSRKLGVTFSGGGDPSLSLGKVRELVELFRRRASELGVNISFGMVCNGSRLKEDDLSFLKKYVDNIVISFDVIPEVHDAQRSHYGTVSDTMRMLSDHGIDYGLRSTVTKLNVNRLTEMVETLHHDFPQCHAMAMEAVLAPELWKNGEELASFHESFANNYFIAQQRAAELGISLGNTIEISSDGIKDRACEGKVVVTPEGKLTACSRVATAGDRNFDDFVFGKVTAHGVVYDKEKYERIMSVRAGKFDECVGCFARYHCGGGCMLARLCYSPAQMASHCEMVRNILKRKLFYELD